MVTLARVTRKARGRSSTARRLACAVAGMELALTLMLARAGASGWPVNLLLAVILLTCIFGEDHVNGALALRQIPPGSREVNTAFQDDGYTSRSQSGESWRPYNRVKTLAETEDYFIFVLDQGRGEVFDKKGFTWGDPDRFREYVREKTRLKIRKVK